MNNSVSKVLVTLDGSQTAEAVLPYARLLASRLSVPVEVVAVIDLAGLARNVSAARSLFLDQLAEDETRSRREYLESIAVSFPQGQASCHILKGNSESAIIEFAARDRGALIAMATHGRSGLNRWLLGSVAEKVLRGSSNPLLLVRASATAAAAAQATIKSILVPLDGSELAETVLPVVVDLAKKLAVGVILFQAYNIPYGFYDVGGGFTVDLNRLLAQTETDVQQYLEEKSDMLKKAGVADVTIASRQGYGADEIINFAGTSSDRLIAICSHGRSGVRRWALGSVTETVVRHSNNPMLIFRTPS